jgi:hypothetical protein
VEATVKRIMAQDVRKRATLPRMEYIIVIDSTTTGRLRRSYLCRLRGRANGWGWTFQREEATEFTSRDEAQRIIETTMRIKSGVLIVPVSEDPSGP